MKKDIERFGRSCQEEKPCNCTLSNEALSPSRSCGFFRTGVWGGESSGWMGGEPHHRIGYKLPKLLPRRINFFVLRLWHLGWSCPLPHWPVKFKTMSVRTAFLLLVCLLARSSWLHFNARESACYNPLRLLHPVSMSGLDVVGTK